MKEPHPEKGRYMIDDSPRGRLRSLLGGLNLDFAKPWVDELVDETRTATLEEVRGKGEEALKRYEHGGEVVNWMAHGALKSFLSSLSITTKKLN